MPNHELPTPSSLSINATTPSIAISNAQIPAASFTPSIAPSISALIRLRERVDSSSGGTAASVSGVSVSGTSNFETTTDAGIARIDAESRCPATPGNSGDRNATYTPSELDATVAKPVVKININSERVIRAR